MRFIQQIKRTLTQEGVTPHTPQTHALERKVNRHCLCTVDERAMYITYADSYRWMCVFVAGENV